MDVITPQNRFTRRQAADRGMVRVIFFVFLATVAGVGWLYIFFVSEAFAIRDIEVRGVQTIDPLEVKREVWAILDEDPGLFWKPTRHFWFLRKTELANKLIDRLFLESVEVDVTHFDILRLMVKERIKKIIVRTPTQLLWVDIQGMILSELSAAEIQVVQQRLTGKRLATSLESPILFLESTTRAFSVGQRITEPDIRSWLDLGLRIEKQGIRFRQIAPAEASSTKIIVTATKGYEVWLDAHKNLNNQLEAFKTLENGLNNEIPREYADFRVPGRIYIK